MATNELSTLEWEYLRYASRWGIPLLGYGEDDGGGGGGGSSGGTDGGSSDGGGASGSGGQDGGTGDGGAPVEVVNEQVQIGSKVLTIVEVGNQRYAVDLNNLKDTVYIQVSPGRWTPDFHFHERGLSFTIIKVGDGSGMPDGGTDGGSGTHDGGTDGGSDGGTGGETDGGTSSNGIRHSYVIVKMGDSGFATIAATVGTLGCDLIQDAGAIFSGAGDDTIIGSAGVDALYGGSGVDLLKGGGGADYLDGGDGYDGVSFAGAAGGVTINLATNQHGGYAAGVTIVNIESVQGTAYNDKLVARERGNGLGTDLHGDGGNDTLIGSAGQEGLFGGEGDDWFDGRDGADTIHGWTGHDAVHGGDGNDSISGGSGNDWLEGGDGADLLDGGADWDTVSYLYVASGVTVDLTTNANGGAAAGDRVIDVEVLQGSGFNDTLIGIDRGNGQGVQLYGEGGIDNLYGRGGGDYLSGGTGGDWLDGGGGNDILNGGDGLNYFAFSSALGTGNVDTIEDFSYCDTIALHHAVFAPSGYLSGNAFKLGTAATTAAHRIIYNQATGDLFYDADGVGGAAQVKFAVLANHAELSSTNFLIW